MTTFEGFQGSQPPTDMPGLAGKHIAYVYENGWCYECFYKNATTLDYRIHSGKVAGRWVKDQKIYMVQLAGINRYKVSWTEPTGTSVTQTLDLENGTLHGTIFFPQWVYQHPERTVVFQNDHLDKICAYREAGPTYPIVVEDHFAKLLYVKDHGVDDNTLISMSPEDAANTQPRLDVMNSVILYLAVGTA